MKLGPSIDGKRVVRAGLQPGEKIVVNGLQRVRPGMPVTPEEQAARFRIRTRKQLGAKTSRETAQGAMNFSHFFIRRPIFAGVLSIVIFLIGLIAMWRLPISEYPEVVPPTIVVQATYPGANPKTIAETVAAPLEQAINGVEDSLYMFSQSTTDGVMTLTVTFKLGTDIDKAQVQVQNRVSQALPKLPEEVRRLGVTTTKQSPDLTMVVHLISPNGRYDEIYLRNYATLQVKDVLARIPGAGSVQVFGSGDYAMRVWLDPDKIAARNLTASDVVSAIREQNVQVAAGGVGQQPVGTAGGLGTSDQRQGPAARGGGVRQHHREDRRERRENAAQGRRARRTRRVSAIRSARFSTTRRPSRFPFSNRPAPMPSSFPTDVRSTMEELKKNFPDGRRLLGRLRPHRLRAALDQGGRAHAARSHPARCLVVILFLQTWRASIIPLAAVPVSLVGTFAVMLALGFSINMLSLFGLVLAIGIVVDDAIVVVENVERNIALGFSPLEATKRAMNEVTGPIIAIALVLCAVFIPTAFISGLTGQFYKQFAITIAISTVISAFNSLTLSPALCARAAEGSRRAEGHSSHAAMDKLFGWFFRPFNRVLRLVRQTNTAAGVGGVLRKSAIALVALRRARLPDRLELQQGADRLRADAGQAIPRRLRAIAGRRFARSHRSRDPHDADIGLKHPGVESRSRIPRPEHQRLQRRSELRHRLLRSETVRGAENRRT